MPNTENNTIALNISRHSKYVDELSYEAGDILPGSILIRVAPDGFIFDPMFDGYVRPFTVAVENSKIGGSIGDPYLNYTRVFCRICMAGDEVLAWLKDGDYLDKGRYLYKAAGGLLSTSRAQPGPHIATALEDISASPGSNVRIKVEVSGIKITDFT